VVGQLLLPNKHEEAFKWKWGSVFDDQKPIRVKIGCYGTPEEFTAQTGLCKHPLDDASLLQASFRRCFVAQTGLCEHPVDDAAVAPC
jgi:hypothetical protein